MTRRRAGRSTVPGLFRARDCPTTPGQSGDAVFPLGAIATSLHAAPARTNIQWLKELSEAAFQTRVEADQRTMQIESGKGTTALRHIAPVPAGPGRGCCARRHDWLQRDGAIVARERFLVALQRFQRIAAIVQRVGIVRGQGEGAIEARQRFVIALQLCQRAAEIAMRVGEIRSDGERLPVAFDGIAMLPERRKHGAAIAVCLEEIRLQLDREIEAVERLLVLVQRVERKAEVEQDPRRRRARAAPIRRSASPGSPRASLRLPME